MAEFILRLIKNLFKNDVIGTAAQTAFYLTLSIPAMLALALSVSSNLNTSGTLFPILEFVFPSNISEILNDFFTALPKSRSVTIISALGVVFSASGSTWALMKGIHKAFTLEKLKFSLKNRLLATFFTLILILSFTISLGSVVIGSVFSALFQTLSKDSFIFDISKRALAVGGVYFFVHLLHKFTPGINVKGKQIFWGAMFSAGCWVSVSMLFGTYIKYFTKYTTVYGGIGAFFILILWLFVISAIILTGAQINGTLLEMQNSRHNTL